jgi:hypothetical protein
MAEAAVRHRPLSSETKGQLAVLFVNRGWERFPVNAKHNELALKDIIGKAEDGKHSRDQVKRYFTVWFKSGGVVAVPRIPLESLEKSLRERCGPAAILIALVKESYEFKACTQGSDQGLRSIVGDEHPIYTTSTWEPLINKLISARATHYALQYNDVGHMAIAHATACSCIYRENLECVKSKAGSDESVVRGVWYMFGKWIHRQMILAWGEKEKQEMALLDEIVNNPLVNELSRSASSQLYYIAGYTLRALSNEGVRRLERGKCKPFLDFVNRNSLPLEEVKVRRDDDLREKPYLSKMIKNDAGGLIWASDSYYRTLVRIEYTYQEMLSDKNISTHGRAIVNRIDEYLCQHETIRSELKVDDSTDSVIKHLLLVYRNMRGKDFVRALLSRSRSTLNVALRKTLKVISDPEKQSSAESSHSGGPLVPVQTPQIETSGLSKEEENYLIGVDEALLFEDFDLALETDNAIATEEQNNYQE